MPSVRAFMGMALLSTLLQFTTAAPLLEAMTSLLNLDCLPTRSPTAPTLPQTGGASELPPVPAGQTLQYAALGRGVQNYTCASTSAAPVALGAIATLFDGTSLDYANEAAFNSLPPKAVYVPLSSFPARVATRTTLGHHYFLADGTPTFDLLAAKGKILYAAKNSSVPAPATADVGPAGTGAVAWLQLTAKPGYNSVGLKTVYRVVTAGGNPPAACPSAGVVSVQYAAEYLFYA